MKCSRWTCDYDLWCVESLGSHALEDSIWFFVGNVLVSKDLCFLFIWGLDSFAAPTHLQFESPLSPEFKKVRLDALSPVLYIKHPSGNGNDNVLTIVSWLSDWVTDPRKKETLSHPNVALFTNIYRGVLTSVQWIYYNFGLLTVVHPLCLFLHFFICFGLLLWTVFLCDNSFWVQKALLWLRRSHCTSFRHLIRDVAATGSFSDPSVSCLCFLFTDILLFFKLLFWVEPVHIISTRTFYFWTGNRVVPECVND